MNRELDHMGQFLTMARDYARAQGFKGNFFIEPKPMEPMKHQYDFDSATAIGFLKEYGLISNTDGTIQLDFEVNSNVKTEFIYNDDLATYEVHLSKGTSSESKFSRTLDIPDTGVLKLDFVNHKMLGKGLEEAVERKPAIIIMQ